MITIVVTHVTREIVTVRENTMLWEDGMLFFSFSQKKFQRIDRYAFHRALFRETWFKAVQRRRVVLLIGAEHRLPLPPVLLSSPLGFYHRRYPRYGTLLVQIMRKLSLIII